MKTLWALIRPYLTVARVTAILTAILLPPVTLLSGKLAVLLVDWGYNLSDAQITAAFFVGMGAAVAAVLPVVIKFIDNRTKFEVAMIHEGQAALLGGKSLSSRLGTQADVPPQPDSVPDLDEGDDDFELSQPDDIAESDADEPDAPERRERLPDRE